jgi:hypothetical protein
VNRWLLEFDVRIANGRYDAFRWDEPDGWGCLLPPAFEWPCSIDTAIWPSVFFMDGFRTERHAEATIPVEPRTFIAEHGRDLAVLRARYEANRELAPDAVFVAVEVLSEKAAEGAVMYYELSGGILCGIPLDPTVPERLPDGSTLLGYDVADAGRFSALTDMGLSQDERRELRPVWAPCFNADGLLATLEDAVAFRGVADRLVPEHAPFWVYALWRLPIP